MKISIVLILCICAMWCEDIKFNQDLVSVFFSPYIFPDDLEDSYDHYDKKDLTKMFKAISTKFSKVMIDNLDADEFNPEWSETLIPSAVAEFNNDNINRMQKLEVTMRYTAQPRQNIHTNFDLAKKLADEANRLHSGTISTILMNYSEDLTNEIIKNLTDSLDYAKKANQQNPNISYKLGAYFFVTDFYDNLNQLERILGKLDVIVFQIDSISSEFTPTKYFSEVVMQIQKCQRKIQEKKRNLKMQFVIYRSDTRTLRSQDVSLLVNFWDQMNRWVTQTNTSIIFYEAFDTFGSSNDQLKFCGWWKATNGVNGSLLDFVIEEKATGVTSMKRPKFKGFSKKHFLVMFDPFVNAKILKKFYVHSGLQNMLKTISSRFDKVVLRRVPVSSEFEKGQSDTLIPSAMAYFNANKTNQGNPMEAVMTCNLEIRKNKKKKTSFDIAKGLADEANMIYNGTVKTILIEYEKLDVGTVKTVKAQLKYSKEKIAKETAFPYNVGMSLHILDCGESSQHLPDYLITILPLINVVYFSRATSFKEVDEGVELSFPLIFKRFERCLLKLRKMHKHLSIGFMSNWPDTNEKGVQNMNALVEFWQRANDWAVALNTTVIMWEAFNNPLRGEEIEKSLGWWKLDQSKEYKDQSEYVFLEKIELATAGNSSISVLPTSSQGLDTLYVVLFGVSGLLSVLVFIGGLAFIIYKRVLKKVDKIGLTKKEMQQFFQGGDFSADGIAAFLNAFCEPYNKDLELSKDDFFIDNTNLLGSGTFGSVFRAVIHPSTEQQVQVAVKMTTSENPSSAIKNLLAEIKILTHVGQHENIVGIVGAYTTEIFKGQVLVFYELCQRGSLESYLRNYSQRHEQTTATTEYVDTGATRYVNSIELSNLEEDEISSLLEKWKYEIANGMTFLAKKQVVHADLATRNVLLTENKTAKISDFGLSRRMYEYQNYFKSQQEPLPWRWLAPESLRQMEFGEKTDVWAFGITLWEMYSFGDVPYPGVSSTDFLKKLEDGLRPDQPRHATSNLYNNVMMKCWEMLPSSRPTFAELKEMLK